MALRRGGAKQIERFIWQTRLAYSRNQGVYEGRVTKLFESSLTRQSQRSQDWKEFSNNGKAISHRLKRPFEAYSVPSPLHMASNCPRPSTQTLSDNQAPILIAASHTASAGLMKMANIHS